ncbi:hypothetical protein KAURM247S_08248 [Kitasatospora aureofaciens]
MRGARPTTMVAASGAGSAARSSFPFGVSGNASSSTNADGTRYSGRRPRRYAASSTAVAPEPATGTT